MARPEQGQEVVEELGCEFLDVFVGIFSDGRHLPNVSFAQTVLLEAVFIAGLLATGLAIPAQTLPRSSVSEPSFDVQNVATHKPFIFILLLSHFVDPASAFGMSRRGCESEMLVEVRVEV
jgi:hypothetical protein